MSHNEQYQNYKIHEAITAALALFESQIKPYVEIANMAIHKYSAQIAEVMNNPRVRTALSAQRAGAVYHEIYEEVLGHDFTQEEIVAQWPKIKEVLKDRLPLNLKVDYREQRLAEFLLCQDVGAHVAVCRSVYPEIEALLRDEMLLSDSKWREQWELLESSQRRAFQGRQLKSLVRNELSGYELVNPSATISEIGIFTAEFMFILEKSFETFDPQKLESGCDETVGVRHIHAHGWAKRASFIDGLNALLTLDMAMQCVSKIKAARKNGMQTNDAD